MEKTREGPETKVAAVFGKAENKPDDIDPKVAELAKEVGKALAKCQEINVIATGGATGYPQIVAEAIRAENPDKEIFAFPPTDEPGVFKMEKVVKKEDQEKGATILALPSKVPKEELEALKSRVKDFLRFTKDNNGAAIIIGGGIGTKLETLSALGIGIPVFVLEGSGGFADQVRDSTEIPADKRDLIHYADTAEGLVRELSNL